MVSLIFQSARTLHRMKIFLSLLTGFTSLTVLSCGKPTSLAKVEAERILASAVAPSEQSMYLQMKAEPLLTSKIHGLVFEEKLTEVGALASFADAFPEPGQTSSRRKPPTANFNSYDDTWYVSCPVVTWRFSQVTDVLNDEQAGSAQVTYATSAAPVEPYYSAFEKYASAIPKKGTITMHRAFFKRFKEGWRLVDLQ
jgi:hypothetical protein